MQNVNLAAMSLCAVLAQVTLSGCDLKFQESDSRVIDERPIRLTSTPSNKRDPAWSPDGNRIVYSATKESTQLTSLPLAGGLAGPPFGTIRDNISGTQFAFSPDATRVVYRSASRGHLWLVHLASGNEFILTPNHREADDPAWSPDGEWIAYSVPGASGRRDIWTVPAIGGSPSQVTSNDDASHPSWAPDGRQLAIELRTDTTRIIQIIYLDSDSTLALTPDSTDNRGPSWSPTDSTIAYYSTRNDTTAIWTRAIGDTLEVRITPTLTSAVNPVWSTDGARIAYLTPTGVWVSARTGNILNSTAIATSNPVWAPGENQLVQTGIVENSVLEVFSLPDSSTRQITEDVMLQLDVAPNWFPDSETIVFARTRPDSALESHAIMTATYSGRRAEPLFSNFPAFISVDDPAVSPDGSLLIFGDGSRIFLSTLASRDVVDLTPFIGGNVREPGWSPAGNGFVCNAGGSLKVFATDSSLVVEERRIPGGFRNPVWSVSHPEFGESIAAESSSGIHALSAEDGSNNRLLIRGGSGPSWSPDAALLTYAFEGQIYVLRILLSLPD